MRRSHEAANSSAPPMQTPSIAAMTGTGDPSTTWVRRWNWPIVAAKASAPSPAASNRSSPAEKSVPAPRTTMQRTSGSVEAAWTAAAIAAMVAAPHALRWRWLSQLTTRALPSSSVLTTDLPLSADDLRQHVPAGGAEDVRGLVLGDRQGAGGELVQGDVGAQRLPERAGVGPALDVDVQRRHDRIAVGDDRVPGAVEQLLDRLRVDVHGLDAEHVVAAAADADARARAAARARRRPDGGEVARAVAQQGRGAAVQVRPDELAGHPVGERERLGGLRVDDLEQRVLAGGQVQPVALAALAGHRRPHVAHPERVGDGDVPRPLDLRAHRAEPGAGLAGGDDVPEAEPGGLEAGPARAPPAIGGGRRRAAERRGGAGRGDGDDVREAERGGLEAGLARAPSEIGGERQRAEERGDAEARDQVEQPPGLPDTDRHDGGARRLDRHVVSDPARVERVVQAVRDGVRRAQAGDHEGLAADRRVRLVILAREADRHRLARRSGGDVQPHELLWRGAQVLAERRRPALALAQLLLGGERQLGELAAALDALSVEGRVRLEVAQLRL